MEVAPREGMDYGYSDAQFHHKGVMRTVMQTPYEGEGWEALQ